MSDPKRLRTDTTAREPVIKWVCSNKLLNPECEAIPTRSIPALTARYHLAGRPAPTFFATKEQCDSDEKHGCAAVDTSIQMAITLSAKAAAARRPPGVTSSLPAGTIGYNVPPSQMLLPSALQQRIGSFLDYNSLASANNASYTTSVADRMLDPTRRQYLDVTRNLPELQKSYSDAKRLLDSYNISIPFPIARNDALGTADGETKRQLSELNPVPGVTSEAAAIIRGKKISLEYLSELLTLILDNVNYIDFPSPREGNVLKAIIEMNLQRFIPRKLRSRLIEVLVLALTEQYEDDEPIIAKPYLIEMMKRGWVDTAPMLADMLKQFGSRELHMQVWSEIIAAAPALFTEPAMQRVLLDEYRSRICDPAFRPYFRDISFTGAFTEEKKVIDDEYVLEEMLKSLLSSADPQHLAEQLNEATKLLDPRMKINRYCFKIPYLRPDASEDEKYLDALDKFFAKIVSLSIAVLNESRIVLIIIKLSNRGHYLAAQALIDKANATNQHLISQIAKHCEDLEFNRIIGDAFAVQGEETERVDDGICRLTDWSNLSTYALLSPPYLLSSTAAPGLSLS
jgi:hypothetical protein